MTTSEQSRSAYILSLARELLDDIELGRLATEGILLKASRLARIVGATKVQQWLSFEMRGYNNSDPISLEYMGHTGRWTNPAGKLGYWIPLAQVTALISAYQTQLATLRIPDLSYSPGQARQYDAFTPPSPIGPAITSILTQSGQLAAAVGNLSAIRSRVLSILHDFIAEVYHEKAFSALAQSIFETYRRAVDQRIAAVAGNLLEKIPSVSDRLAEGDPEAVSQGLTTCRRLLEALADGIYPATEPVEIDGETVELGPEKHKNRINAFIGQRLKSESRRKKVRQTLANLWERVSGAVHSEVTLEEARSLFLETYLFLGEVVGLAESVPSPVSQGSSSTGSTDVLNAATG